MPSRGRAGAGQGRAGVGIGLRTSGLGPRGSGPVCDREDPTVCAGSLWGWEEGWSGKQLGPDRRPMSITVSILTALRTLRIAGF